MNLILPRQVLSTQDYSKSFTSSFINKKNTGVLAKTDNSLMQKSQAQAVYLVHAATSLITSYFAGQPCLISKPVFTSTNSTVTIQLFYYVPNLSNSSNLYKDSSFSTVTEGNKEKGISKFGANTDIDTLGLSSLTTCLAQLYQKEVKLELTRVHYPYMNSYILAQYLCHNAPSNTFVNFQEAILTYPSLNATNLPSYINGIKIRLSGRLVTEPLVPRMTMKNSVRASRSFSNSPNMNSGNNLNLENNYVLKQSAMIDYAKYTYKNELGAFTIKVWIGTTG